MRVQVTTSSRHVYCWQQLVPQALLPQELQPESQLLPQPLSQQPPWRWPWAWTAVTDIHSPATAAKANQKFRIARTSRENMQGIGVCVVSLATQRKGYISQIDTAILSAWITHISLVSPAS